MDNIEIWKDIPGYENAYRVSNFGRVKSLDRYTNGRNGCKVFKKGQFIKPEKINTGYLSVGLRKNDIREHFLLHRLVALLFVHNPNPEKYTIINHKDCNKENCRADNLEWCDHHYNNTYGNHKKLQQMSMKCYKINQYTLEGILIATYPSICEAARQTGCYQSKISDCCKGKYKQHKGFIWRYL